MKKIACILLFVIMLMQHVIVKAQQGPLLSHYMFNGLLLNPAYAGSKDFVSATLLYRKQWVGIEGAPVTYSGTIHGLLKKKRLGLGAVLLQDKIGETRQTDLYATLAYHLPVGSGKLSFGMQAGVSNFNSDVVKLRYWDPGDRVFDYNTFSNMLPNAGFGLYYYEERFYAGVSAPFVVTYDANQAVAIDPGVPVHKQSRRYYATTGAVIETEGELKFKPSLMVRYEPNTRIQYDINLNVLINDIFWIGASYRAKEAVVALFEYQASRKLRFGYSYDYTLGELSNFNSGSHELMIGYDFGVSATKMKSPRYF